MLQLMKQTSSEETCYKRAKVLPICTTRHMLCAEDCVAFVKHFGCEKH